MSQRRIIDVSRPREYCENDFHFIALGHMRITMVLDESKNLLCVSVVACRASLIAKGNVHVACALDLSRPAIEMRKYF